MRSIHLRTFTVLFASSLLSLTAAAEPRQFGRFERLLPDLNGACEAAYDPAGRLWVVERDRGGLTAFEHDGQRRFSLAAADTGLGMPVSLAVDRDGVLYVADARLEQVVVLRVADGAVTDRRTIGERGFEEGAFFGIGGLCVAGDRVYVADTGNQRLQVFRTSGEFVRTFGAFGVEPGRFRRPVDVAVDTAGFIYVADADNCRIQKLSPEGTFVRAWGEWGYFPGMFTEPSGVEIHAERVYVTDHRNHRVGVFDLDGGLLYEWGLHALRPREADGKLHYPDTVAISADGTHAAVTEAFEDRVQVFGLETPAEAAARFNPLPPGSGPPSAHFGAYMDIDGELMVVTEPDAHGVNVYDLEQYEPILIHSTGGHGTAPGQYTRPRDVVLDRDAGRLLVLDAGNRRIQELSCKRPGGELRYLPDLTRVIRSVDLVTLTRQVPDFPAGGVLTPVAIERATDGSICLLDAASGQVVVFSSGWEYSRAFGEGELGAASDFTLIAGTGDAAAEGAAAATQPTSRAARADALAVLDGAGGRIAVYALTGRRVTDLALGPAGDDADALRPFGIAAAAADGAAFLVTEWRDSRVLRVGRDGPARQLLGGPGLAAGRFRRPTTLGFDRAGRLIVLDWGNHRGQVFGAEPARGFVQAFGSRLFVEPARGAAESDE